MDQNKKTENQNEVLIKFLVPKRLKLALQERAVERNITVSALLRLIASEYVKRTQ